MLRIRGPLHSFHHVHLDLGYFICMSYSLVFTLVEAFALAFRLRGMSSLFSGLIIRVATATITGGC